MTATLWQDVRYAVRWLRRSPGFALVAVLSLALGIGLNTAIFSIVDALLLRPLPVADPSRLVDLYTSGADGDTYSSNSLPDLLDYRAQSAALEDVAGYSLMFAAVNRGERTRLVLGEIVTGNYFRLLGVKARLGRALLPDDDTPQAARVVVLSHRAWQREFGGDPGIVGRSLRIRGEAFTIVGVLADGFTGMTPMLAPELWTPVRWVSEVEPAGINENTPSPTGTTALDRRGRRWLFAKARLAPGATFAQAQQSVELVAGRLRADHVQTNRERRVTLRPTTETRLHPAADGLLRWLVRGTMAAVTLVLMIACANVAGMLLARASSRRREIGVRLALGAGRGRIVRQLVTESLVLASISAVLGVAVAWLTTRLLSTFDLPIPIALSLDLRLDGRVLAFSVLAAVATGVLTGLVPALRATRPDLVADIRSETGAELVSGRRWSGLEVLTVVQVALTLVLLVSAALLGRSLFAAGAADVGFRAAGLALVSADIEMSRYSRERGRQFWAEAERRVATLPGVTAVARASRTPFSLNYNRRNIAIPGRQRTADEMGASIVSAEVSPAYFQTLGVPLLAGRVFSDADSPDTRIVVVVNETMARRYWTRDSAVGQLVYERTLDSGRAFEIVGVVADHKLQTVGEPAQPAIYFATDQSPRGYQVLVARGGGDDRVLLAQMRRSLLELEPNLVIFESETMRGQVSTTLLPIRAAATLLAVFSVLGLLLAALGVYGVIAYAVSRRTREIGIRVAVGAQPASVLGLVMRRGLVLVGVGVIIGGALAAAATQALAGALYGVGAIDPLAWGGAAGVLVATSLFANLVPARRALRVDPIRALRAD